MRMTLEKSTQLCEGGSDTPSLIEHLSSQTIDSQYQSPLYRLLPAEIRNHVFEYVLTDYFAPRAGHQVPDFAVRPDHEPGNVPDLTKEADDTSLALSDYDTAVPSKKRPRRIVNPAGNHHLRVVSRGYDWERPDRLAHSKTDTALLRTCRRVYLETHAFPLLLREHTFYCFRGNNLGSKSSRYDIQRYFQEALEGPSSIPGLRQRDLVRSVRIFAQLFWLEDPYSSSKFWHLVKNTDYLKSVENLRITIRRSDWWHWENNCPPKLNPFRGVVDLSITKADMVSEDGNPPFQRDNVWGLAFQHMPNLKTLTMDFETSENHRKDLEAIVEWATSWKFPLAGNKYLTTSRQETERMSWLGRDFHWSDSCFSCGATGTSTGPGCHDCAHRAIMSAHGYGPRMYLWTVTWKRVSGKMPC